MKSIFALILLFFVALNETDDDIKFLRDWYMNNLGIIQKLSPDNVFYQHTRNLNLRCITKSIEYNKNQETILNFTESVILIYGSGLKCLDSTKQDKVWKLLADKLVEYFFYDITSKDLTCFKLELKKLDPSSEYVLYFDDHLMTINTEKCEEIVDMMGVDLQLSVAESTFGELSTLTQGALDSDKFRNILLSLAVLRDDSNGKDQVIMELKNYFTAALKFVKNKLKK